MSPSSSLSRTSSQGYVDDPRNENVLIYVNGDFFPRDKASVSVFDAGFVLGDGVWEGLRLVKGRLLAVDDHMDRLFEGAGAIQLDIGLSREGVVGAIQATLDRNGMTDGAHIRLMVTRGTKKTPNQDPRFALGPATIVIVAEYKAPRPETKEKGLSLFTSTIRCSGPDVFDLRLNSHSRLNFIQALIQAINAGADEALMLDPHGFVASCNSTNFFVVRGRELWTSTGRYNFKGITRKKVIGLHAADGGTVREHDFTLAETYAASEAFVTGTLGGITPVTSIDGRTIGDGKPGPVTRHLAGLYAAYVEGA
ncbi:Branched-chain-amino-acid aminotransferase [Hartmannibacter diazotrophicus]|uniref:Probable branched-chain-amino-acid aminotransferase n=1 Tax=Hartmannibacter diazotrophicus TaxID=1482074 RepID=A0A2C9D6T9_9HYPH|nr:aminotransferase class IV [Hartmannibacter diazotrophicus]SON56044.1 Branched-chain-amino-acid aminotransferase [Hartmannibacter diazotrophicus]